MKKVENNECVGIRMSDTFSGHRKPEMRPDTDTDTANKLSYLCNGRSILIFVYVLIFA